MAGDQPGIAYACEPGLDVEEFRHILIDSGLGAIRPVNDLPRLAAALSGAGLIVTARLDAPGRPLVGVARSITDGAWCCYLADLAVSAAVQRRGVGQKLLDETRRQVGPRATIVLVSVDDAVGFYERAGMARLKNGFWYRRTE